MIRTRISPTALALVCLCGSAAAAQTACVTAADLRRGITVDFDDGISEVYREIRPGIASVAGMEAGQQLYRLEVAQGTHLLDYVEYAGPNPDEQTRQVYDYGQPAEALPVPADGGRFGPTVTVTASDGTRTETQAQAYVAGDPLVLGDCTYAVVNAVIAYETADNYIESITYLPELGIGFLAWSETDSGRGAENAAVAIRTGK